MRKIAIIPSKTPNICEKLVDYFQEAGWELFVMSGCSSIFEAYEKGLKEANVTANDYVILCHDDIEILTNAHSFNVIIDGFLKKYKIGFIGVGGTKVFQESCVWWDGLQFPQQDHLSGVVYHGKNIMEMQPTSYGLHGRVVALDGVFLACKGSTLLSLKLQKPKDFIGDWDFYDIYYTLQAHMKGFDNYTVPIHILHKSLGETAGKDSWHYNKKAMQLRLHHLFPIRLR